MLSPFKNFFPCITRIPLECKIHEPRDLIHLINKMNE